LEKDLKAGAVGFLEKPFNGQELVDLVNRAFDKS
jgi:FixJ family two-component response regulator